MDPLAILHKYYRPEDPAYAILVEHSRAVTDRALAIGQRMGADLRFIEEAGMLHDLGVFKTHAPGIGCHGPEHYMRHGILGRELLEQEGYPRHGLVCERHVGTGLTAEEIERQGLPLPLRDMRPVSLEEQIIAYADKFYSKGSGALEVEEVRRRLGRHGPQNLVTFDAWRARFEPEGIL
ncbi:MAG: HD domain-containing protein [Vulcanimicrobiota bacterium]